MLGTPAGVLRCHPSSGKQHKDKTLTKQQHAQGVAISLFGTGGTVQSQHALEAAGPLPFEKKWKSS
jgi:hypothetical protein